MKITLLTIVLGLATSLQGVAQTLYQMAGPYEVIARDGAYRHTKAGSERDMKAALDFAIKGDTAQALRIINAYAQTLQRIEGHDAPLCLIQCYNLVRAMIMIENGRLKIENEVAQESASQSSTYNLQSSMIRRAILPVIERFDADSPYANGNWGAIVNRCRMACAICLKDSTLYRSAIDYFLHAFDNGALPHYIGPTGQCQETGRDQAHVQLGLQALAETCEMAWQQGDDLWGALDNRLLKGFEYTARYNLGYEVPFETWHDCTGLYNDWTEPGQMNRGQLWDIYELPYHHYVERKGLSMPYTKRIIKGQKPKVKPHEKLHQIFTYPAPAGAPLKHDYEVCIRPRSSQEWTRIDTYMAKVNAQTANAHRISEISYAQFDFTGDVFVRVVCKNKKFQNVRIRPHFKGIIPNVQNDSTVQFLLFQPENVSVEFDADITSNLLLFTARPPEGKEDAERQAKTQGRRFVYFPPGLYAQADIDKALAPARGVGSETVVYLAGGSYFTGTFSIEDAENVSILGRGIARPADGYEGCHVHRSRHVLIDGLTLNTCPVGGSSDVTIRGVRSISHPAWGDGLNVFASSNVTYDRVFCRNSDDCTTAYATRKGFEGNCRNIRMTNATLWADVAHPIFIGIHGNAEQGDTIENLVYENIDILGQAEPQVDYQGCLAINCGDNNLVRHVTFDNIRIEPIAQGSLLQVKVGWNQKYCAAPGRSVDDVTFRNIRYNAVPAAQPANSPANSSAALSPSLSIIAGYDELRKVKNIHFESLKINGRPIYDTMPGKPKWYATADYVPLFVGNHVESVTFER